VVIDDGTVITPAALDLAFTRGIQVVYRRSNAHAAEKGPSKEQGVIKEKTAGLKDGDYLVQIREGQARIFEIRDEGISKIR
jgi:hypothetical protein